MDEQLKQELNILLGVVEGVCKFLAEDGSELALMLKDGLFEQYWKLVEVLKKSPGD